MADGERLVIALEGPSDSGKSTVADRVSAALGEPATVLPCYVDFAKTRLPEPCAESVDDQIDGLDFYLDLDVERTRSIEPSDPGPVIMDRCWLSLAAHLYAVEKLGGPKAYERGLATIRSRREEILDPHLTFPLKVSPASRAARMAEADRGKWFTCAPYNAELDDFMTARAPSLTDGQVIVLDGDAPVEQTCDRIVGEMKARA